jgi:hypothetical protein
MGLHFVFSSMWRLLLHWSHISPSLFYYSFHVNLSIQGIGVPSVDKETGEKWPNQKNVYNHRAQKKETMTTTLDGHYGMWVVRRPFVGDSIGRLSVPLNSVSKRPNTSFPWTQSWIRGVTSPSFQDDENS